MASNPAFAVMSYLQDVKWVPLVEAELALYYPAAPVYVISDLPPNRLKMPQYAGQWTQRYMEAFLGGSPPTTNDYLIKIDPDTQVTRTLTTFPDADVFGNLIDGNISGGAIGFTRVAVQAIVDSGFLLDSKYTAPAYSLNRWKGQNLRPGEAYNPDDMPSYQDAIVTDVVTRLGLTVAPWPDAYAHVPWWVSPPPGNFAFVHPRPEVVAMGVGTGVREPRD